MSAKAWATILGWQSLDEKQRQYVEDATQHVEAQLTLEDVASQTPVPEFPIGKSDVWTDTMRAVFSSWWKQAGWRVHLFAGSDGVLVASLRKGQQ